MRRAVAGLTGALPLLAVLPAVPASAETVTTVIQASNESGHKDHLQIDFSGYTKVKTVQAHLVPKRHKDAPAIDVTDFTFSPPVGQFQRAIATVRPGVLDTYTVEVTATDTEGNSLQTAGQGPFAFLWGVQAQFDLSLDKASADNPQATLHGHITGLTPQGQPVALHNVKLSVQDIDSPGSQTQLTTDADGRFTYTFRQNSREDWLDGHVGDDSDNPDLDGGNLWYRATSAVSQTRLKVSVSPDRLHWGDTATVRGFAEHNVNGVWKPLPGHAVYYGGRAGYSCPAPDNQTATTDDSGHFSVPLKIDNSYPVTACVGGDTFHDPSEASAPIVVPYTADLSGLRWTFDPYGRVALDGCFGGYSGHQPRFQVEYSPDGRGAWTVARKYGGSFCSFQASWNRSGFWRPHVLRDRYNDEVFSPAAKLWRWNARFEHFRVSPGKVRKNHSVTVSGSLTRAVSMTKRTGYAGRTIEVVFRFKGKKTWYHLAWAKTDRYGRFSKKVKAYGSGYYAVVFRGGPDTFADWTSGKDYVRTYAVPTEGAIIPTRPDLPTVVPAQP
ncbi:hypothetical protein [Actinomadura rupiterrae]|uniref:hypothetical protein n=1 Tax=Actinomadura rupiterrae TaxID=559627 RepID=UPI0020A5DC0C|nr:hypothetical protein [Actinomadura rupiterrae]MCP2340412.1 hypothetical protein [Actinomadura rupiterrae]